MTRKHFELGFGDGTLSLALPEERILHVVEGRAAEPVADVAAAARHALRNPIGSPPLAEVVVPGDRVAIVAGDITRAWIGFHRFLPVILDELNAAGVPDRDIFLVVALGAHRPHRPDEDLAVYGAEVCRRIAVHQHDCHDAAGLRHAGTTRRGVELFINKLVAEADKVILTGGIVYHLMAGFGGGRKAIMPGVSAFSSIQGNHLLCMNEVVGKGLNPNCVSGKLRGNEMHEETTEMAALARPDFLLNAVFTPAGEVARFVAGHWYEAWLAGTELVEEIYGIPIAARADLVIASAGGFPKDINLYQGSKTIDNADMAVRPGGAIICLLECRDIHEPGEFAGWFQYAGDLARFELAVRARFTVPGFIAYKIADIARRNTLIVVTRPENAEFMRKAGILPAGTLDEAFALARRRVGEATTITVMPHAANTVPLCGS